MTKPGAKLVAPLIVLLGAGACGEATPSQSAQPDAGVTPDPIAEPDAPSAGVKVQVYSEEGHRQRGADVYFHDADGELVGRAVTDDDGIAGRVPASSQVTIISREGLTTFTNVVDGDMLTFTGRDLPRNDPFKATLVGRYLVQLPGALPGATQYMAQVGGCSGTTSDPSRAFEVEATDYCATVGDGVIAFSLDATNKKLGVGWVTGLKPRPPAAINVTVPSWVTPSATTFSVSPPSLPPDLELRGSLSMQLGGRESFYLAGFERPPAQVGVDVPVGFPELAFVASATTQKKLPSGVPVDGAVIAESRLAGPFNLNLADVLPPITTASVKAIEGNRFEITWSPVDALANADGGIVGVGFTNPEIAPNDIVVANWYFVVPPGTTTVRTPRLPADTYEARATKNPRAVYVQFLDSDALAGYDAFKRAPTPFGCQGPFRVPLPPRDGARLRSVFHRQQ